MADIHITRTHKLGLEKARKLALRWAEVAEKKLDMECTYEEGRGHDVVHFKRPGAHGELHVAKDKFALDAKLGLLLGVFRHRIETEIVSNLDQLLSHHDPLNAFEEGLARHEAQHEGQPAHGKPHAQANKPVKTPAKTPAKKAK